MKKGAFGAVCVSNWERWQRGRRSYLPFAMLSRNRMFQRILIEKEIPSALALTKKIGWVIVRERLLFVTGMRVAGVDERICVYYPGLQKVHVQGHLSFGHMLTKEEYRQQRARLVAGAARVWQSTLFSSPADMAAYYRGAAA